MHKQLQLCDLRAWRHSSGFITHTHLPSCQRCGSEECTCSWGMCVCVCAECDSN